MGIINTGNRTEDVLTHMVSEDKVPWYKKPNLRRLYLVLFFCCMGVEMTSGFDSQLMNTLQFSDHFRMYLGNGYEDEDGNPAIRPALLGFINSSYQLGSVLAVPIAPYVNQRFGRRWGVMIGSLTMVVGAMLQGLAQHVAMYIIARILLGVGVLFAIISGSSLLAELSYPKERAVLTTLFNASYYIGAILAAAITLATVEINGDMAWRIPSWLQICPSLLQISTVFFLPDSPRWLVSRERDDEAYAVLIKYHAEGNAADPIVHAEMSQIRNTIALEIENAKMSWLDMVRTSGNRRRVFIAAFLGLFTQMSGNTLLSYYSNLLFQMMGYTSSYAKSRINIANLCWHLMVAVPIALVITRFPRRWVYMISTSSMCLMFIGMTVAFERLDWAKRHGTTNRAASNVAMFFYFAYTPCNNMGNYALTYTYLIELFPYATRSRGIGVSQVFGKLGGFFSNNVNPIGLTAIGWRFMAIYCGWIFVEFLFQAVFYPETYNRTLEELAFLFESDELRERQHHDVVKDIEEPKGSAHREIEVRPASP